LFRRIFSGTFTCGSRGSAEYFEYDLWLWISRSERFDYLDPSIGMELGDNDRQEHSVQEGAGQLG
jgi:hypothetical protein